MTTTADATMRAGRSLQIHQSKAAARRLIAAYRDVWTDIHAQLTRLEQQIADARAIGGEDAVKVSWLYREQRLQQLEQQTVQALTRFTGGAEQLTADLMRQSAQDGATAATDALQAMLDSLQLPPGVNVAFNRLNFGALDDAANNVFTYGVQAKSGGAPRRTIAGLYKSMPPDLAKRAKRTILYAVATGQHPSVTARQLKQQLGIGLNRALMIARTEQMNAYRRSGIATFAANSDVCQAWKWLAAADACPFCQSMNGTEHPLDEAMDSHPNCRCVPSPVARPLSEILASVSASV